MYIDKKKKRFILIIAIILLIAIVAIAYLYKKNSEKNVYGDGLEIVNLSDYTKGKPSSKDSLNYIKYDLLRTVNKNINSPVDSNSIKDVLIRDNTFSQVYDDDIDVYTVDFIVDIESLSQSYSVSYQWSTDGKKDNLTEWGTVVKCLPKEKLVYGAFNCKDMFTELNSPADPILKYLPYSSIDFKVTYDPNTTRTLNATIYTTAADERIDPNTAIKQYKADVRKWISSTGIDADDYKINYTIVRASLY